MAHELQFADLWPNVTYLMHEFLCVFDTNPYLNIEECVEVRDDDVLVLHLAPHVLDGVDGRLIIWLWTTAEGELLQPEAARLKQSIKHQPGQLHRLHF